VGVGTTFTVHLPVAMVPADIPEAEVEDPEEDMEEVPIG
jgi:hypothetical protein